MEFGLFDGGKVSEHSSLSLVEILSIFAMQGFFLGAGINGQRMLVLDCKNRFDYCHPTLRISPSTFISDVTLYSITTVEVFQSVMKYFSLHGEHDYNCNILMQLTGTQ